MTTQTTAEKELFDFLRIPSVSSDPTREDDMAAAAEFLHHKLEQLGFQARVAQTQGHPLVYAERLNAPGQPTVMIYGHYDVQPETPLEEWLTPPFEPTVREGRIYARGATDDKGQVYAHIRGVEQLLEKGELPVNVKFLIEGEEEIGSPSLELYLKEHVDELACDVIVISDGSRFGPDVPSVTYGLRGIAYIEVHVGGANRDLHSGSYGGAAPNPINALAQIIAGLKDENNRITIPGFYDNIAEPTAREQEMWNALPHSDAEFAASIGVSGLPGEAGYTTLERLWARPTLDVNGIWGGFQGEGSKTVIPAKAGAKISMRLVPGQDYRRIVELTKKHLQTLAPESAQVQVIEHHHGEPFAMELDSPFIAAAERALEKVWKKKPAFTRSGGSIPIVSSFQSILGAPILFVDMGLNEDAPHSPNESFALADYHAGIETSAALLEELAQQ